MIMIYLIIGENKQIPPFLEICSKKALFQNLLGKYHFYGIRVYETRVPRIKKKKKKSLCGTRAQ